MEIRWTLVVLVVISGLVLQVCSSEDEDGESTKDEPTLVETESESDTRPSLKSPLRPFMRRRVVRKKVINGAKSNSTNKISVSMSVTEGDADSQTETGSPTRRPLFSRLRSSSFLNRTRPSFMTTPVGIPTPSTPTDIVETPNTSFKLKMRPRLPFGRIKTTANSISDDDDEEEPSGIGKSSTTAKPFIQRKPFKSRFTAKGISSTTTTTEEPSLDVVEEHEETAEDDDQEKDEATQEKEESEEQAEKPSASTESPNGKYVSKNSSMIIIPVPPSQRKPYHPVIMQVTKNPSSTPESRSETKVTTFKLNKMFIPVGIYGKVLPKTSSMSQGDKELVSRNTIVSTPLPFLLSGQSKGKKSDSKSESKASKSVDKKTSGTARPQLKTISPEIKVKGHRSEEVPDMQMSGDSSRDYASAVAYAASQKEHHVRQQRQWETMMEKLKEKHRKNIVDTISLTYDYKPNLDQISLTTEKVNVGDVSLTTEHPAFLSSFKNMWGNMRQKSPSGTKYGIHELSPPHPQNRLPVGPPQLVNQQPSKSIFHTITSAASSLPGLIHDGLTSLSSYPNPFEDDSFSASSTQNKVQIPVPISPQGPPRGTTSSESETLEFFRKRPYLLQGQAGRDLGKEIFIQPEYSSGFKPVTAPVHFASQYYASTPKPSFMMSSTTPSTIETYVTEERDPIFKGSQLWPVTSTIRTPKQFEISNDLWRGSSSFSSSLNKHPFAEFGVTSTSTPRPSYLSGPSTPKSFTTQWMDFNRKYTKAEIEEAKERIFSMFTRSENPVYDAMMYMKPPAESKSSNTNAFDDLLKMFRMGFSFGAGHTASSTPMVNYNAGMYNDDTEKSASSYDGGWKPVSKSNNSPVISLNAGITFGGKPNPAAMMPGHGVGTHFSSSTKPYLPGSQYKEFFNPKNHYSSSSKVHSYSSTPAPTSNYFSSSYQSSFNRQPETSYHSDSKLEFSKSPFSTSYYKPTEGRPLSFSSSEVYSPSSFTGFKSQYSSDPAIEIIPSSVFFKQKGNMNDIAAIIRPPDLSSDLVKAALPPQIASVPQLSYPTQQLIQNPQSFTSLSQLQHYFATAQPVAQPTPVYASMAPTHGQLLYVTGAPNMHQQVQYLSQPGYVPQQQHQQLQQRPARPYTSSQGGGVKASGGDSNLGFSNFELPAGLDPDIASLIKTELEKDDVPDEYRQDFEKAKEEEKSKKSSQTQINYREPSGAASSLRVTVLKPNEDRDKHKSNSNNRGNSNTNMERRSDKGKLEVKFHKPVPITPTMLTPAKGKPIRASPVPKYVVELARKLKNEKDVQGIVRVSTKRERGPPIEYLYPVRG